MGLPLLVGAGARTLQALRGQITVSLDGLPEPWPGTEEDYQELLAMPAPPVPGPSRRTSTESRQNMVDYYTLWAHQIKTPIAALKLAAARRTTVSAAGR